MAGNTNRAWLRTRPNANHVTRFSWPIVMRRGWSPPEFEWGGSVDKGSVELRAIKSFLAGGKTEHINNVGAPIDALLVRGLITDNEALAARHLEKLRAGLMPPYASCRSTRYDDWRLDRSNEPDEIDSRRQRYINAQRSVCKRAGARAWSAVADVAIHHAWPAEILNDRGLGELALLRLGLDALVRHFGIYYGNNWNE
jgi:hypothetical protein